MTTCHSPTGSSPTSSASSATRSGPPPSPPSRAPSSSSPGTGTRAARWARTPRRSRRRCATRGSRSSVRLYPGARHELLNETNRDEVTADVIAWLRGRAALSSLTRGSGAGSRRPGRRRWRPRRPRAVVRTWRSPASPRSCTHASCRNPKPWSRPGGQLAAVGVQRQLAVEGDARAALDERAALALAAEAERLEPRHGEEAEPVVELGDVDVGGREVGAGPQLGARRRARAMVVRSSHWSHDGRPPQRGADRLDTGDGVVDRAPRARRPTRRPRSTRRRGRRSRTGRTAW